MIIFVCLSIIGCWFPRKKHFHFSCTFCVGLFILFIRRKTYIRVFGWLQTTDIWCLTYWCVVGLAYFVFKTTYNQNLAGRDFEKKKNDDILKNNQIQASSIFKSNYVLHGSYSPLSLAMLSSLDYEQR